jgi:hypothetical protein
MADRGLNPNPTGEQGLVRAGAAGRSQASPLGRARASTAGLVRSPHSPQRRSPIPIPASVSALRPPALATGLRRPALLLCPNPIPIEVAAAGLLCRRRASWFKHRPAPLRHPAWSVRPPACTTRPLTLEEWRSPTITALELLPFGKLLTKSFDISHVKYSPMMITHFYSENVTKQWDP